MLMGCTSKDTGNTTLISPTTNISPTIKPTTTITEISKSTIEEKPTLTPMPTETIQSSPTLSMTPTIDITVTPTIAPKKKTFNPFSCFNQTIWNKTKKCFVSYFEDLEITTEEKLAFVKTTKGKSPLFYVCSNFSLFSDQVDCLTYFHNLYSEPIEKKPSNETIYLVFSFDTEYPFEAKDGNLSEQNWTFGMARLLSIAKKYNVSFQYFILGKTAEKYPYIFKALADEGQRIAGHSYQHRGLDLHPDNVVIESLTKTKTLLENITGKQVVGHRYFSF